MVAIPEKTLNLLKAEGAVKALITADKTGLPHAIVCGSIIAPDAKTIAVGEVLMKTSAANMKANDKVAIMVNKGMEAYTINGKVKARITEGPLFDGMKAELAKLKLPCFAVWVFDVCCVYDQSAGPAAGSKIA